jgi:dolichyl-phosphate-mannose-protein mannosyltransferase
LLILSAVSALMHFWRLFTPNAVVWDEIHFEKHAGHYLAGTFYFDVHPPLGKLLYAAEARVFGIPASTLLQGLPAPSLRVLPALLGTLIVPLVYVLLRQLGAARRVATLGAFVILCENALLVDARVALLEPYVISFGLLAITAFFAASRRLLGWTMDVSRSQRVDGWICCEREVDGRVGAWSNSGHVARSGN